MFWAIQGWERCADIAPSIKFVKVLLNSLNVGVCANIRKSGKHTFSTVIYLILLMSESFAKKSNISGNYVLGLRLKRVQWRNYHLIRNCLLQIDDIYQIFDMQNVPNWRNADESITTLSPLRHYDLSRGFNSPASLHT